MRSGEEGNEKRRDDADSGVCVLGVQTKECERIVEERGLEPPPTVGGPRKAPNLHKPKSRKVAAPARVARHRATDACPVFVQTTRRAHAHIGVLFAVHSMH